MGRQPHHPPLNERFGKAPVEAMVHRLKTPEGRALHALRKQTPEPVSSIIKSVPGFRQFSLRGPAKVRGEWSLVTMAWNIKRMFALGLASCGRRAPSGEDEDIDLSPVQPAQPERPQRPARLDHRRKAEKSVRKPTVRAQSGGPLGISREASLPRIDCRPAQNAARTCAAKFHRLAVAVLARAHRLAPCIPSEAGGRWRCGADLCPRRDARPPTHPPARAHRWRAGFRRALHDKVSCHT